MLILNKVFYDQYVVTQSYPEDLNMSNLTFEEKITNYATMQHIHLVNILLHKVVKLLLERADKHDESKLTSPEVEEFAKYTSYLNNLEYGTDAYNKYREKLSIALKHHYQINRHHPEYFENGINDMNLIDIVEMFVDWVASTPRSLNGDINKSIIINAKRFKIDQQLTNVFKNTALLLSE